MISDKTDTNCNEARGIDWGYTSITRAYGIQHGCVSEEQQALLGRQSATAKVANEVREKSSVKLGAKEEKNKGQLDNGGELEAGGNERSEGTATM